MSVGRTTWRAKPCGWRDRERIVALGEEHGPAGPLLLDVLEELAKEQRGDGGTVRTGLRSLARAAFLPRGTTGVDQAREILRFASRVGAIDELAVGEDEDMTVTCRVSGFAADQGKGYESVRKGQQRAENCPDDRDNDPSSPEARDSVPFCPPTGQDRTGQRTTSVEPSASTAVEPAKLDEARGRLQAQQVQQVFDAWVQSRAAQHGITPRAVLGAKRRKVIRQALTSHGTETTLAAVVGWRNSPHHRGENDRHTPFDDLELLLRDAAHIEKFAELARRDGHGSVSAVNGSKWT